jgi:formylglycine-generating enzyme required for sulfatase activity
MGAPASEEGYRSRERLHWQEVPRRYAIATRPVTLGEYQRFLKAHPKLKHSAPRQYARDQRGPVTSLNWYEAAQYCRWLSEQEGFPEHEMVYPSVAEIENWHSGQPLRLPADYLKRKGYRLPTEAEWEQACRAGTRTSRYYGSSLDLLSRHAWFLGNSRDRPWPVGQKKPNDLGLFDMLGNVSTWCHDAYHEYASSAAHQPAGDPGDPGEVTERAVRILRGGSFLGQPGGVRSAHRSQRRPLNYSDESGLRVARTCGAAASREEK